MFKHMVDYFLQIPSGRLTSMCRHNYRRDRRQWCAGRWLWYSRFSPHHTRLLTIY
jgi:hypothetical protein